MKIHECKPFSPEHLALRRGKATASGAKRIITPAKWQYAAAAKEYAFDLACELIDPYYGFHEDYQTAAMKNGTLMEPEARRWYEYETECDVTRDVFCISDCGRWGCSPDGLIGDDGGLELKSPTLKVHAQYLLAGELPTEYAPQVHWSLIVTERRWFDFMSYAHGLPPFRIRVEPNEKTDKLREAMELFWVDFTEIRDAIAALIPPPPPPKIVTAHGFAPVEMPAYVAPF